MKDAVVRQMRLVKNSERIFVMLFVLSVLDLIGKVSKKKPQIEVYKKQVNELNTKLGSENERADKLAFDNAKLMEKLEALSVERDRIMVEKNSLKEINEELKLTVEVRLKFKFKMDY